MASEDDIHKNNGEDKEAQVLILNGVPIKEPIFAYGPFVMNSREEIIRRLKIITVGKWEALTLSYSGPILKPSYVGKRIKIV